MIANLYQRSQLHSRFNQLFLEFHGGHIGQLDGFPVNQPNAAGGQCLTKVIHGSGRLVGVCARYRRHIGHTLNGRHRVIQIDAGIGKFADILGHVGKRIDGSVRISIQLVQLLIDDIQAFTCAGHDGLNRAHLQLILIKTALDWVDGKCRKHPLARVDCRIRNIGQGGHRHDLQGGKSGLNGLQRTAELGHITPLRRVIDLFQPLCRTLHIKALLEPVQRIQASLHIRLELLVVKSHFNNLFVNRSAHGRVTSLHASFAICSKIGRIAGLM